MILNNIVNTLNRSLLLKNFNNVVIGFKRKRSVYDFTGYNQQWVPRVNPYSKHRKPRLAAWTDPKIQFPRIIPPMHSPGNPKKYLKELEQQQRIKIARKRNFLMPPIRSGDIVEISYQQTFQNQNVVKYKGFVIGITKRNSLLAGMKVAIRLAGVNLLAHYLLNSPKIKNVEIVARGSGNHKARLLYLWNRNMFTKAFIHTPLRNKAMKKRGNERGNQKGSEKLSKSLILDKVQDDSVKRKQL